MRIYSAGVCEKKWGLKERAQTQAVAVLWVVRFAKRGGGGVACGCVTGL